MATHNYRHRAYHKTGYQIPATSYPIANATTIPLEKDHRVVAHFAQAGIEKNAGATGFAYGSDETYTNFREGYRECRHRINDRTSAELLRLKQQQREAERDIAEYQERKAREQQEKAAEKRRDLEMLQNYKPWGKQTGGGAPRTTLSGTRDAQRQRMEFDAFTSEEYYPFGKSGGGAPLKTGSGKLQTSLKADPTIRFQNQLMKEVNDTLRYKPDESDMGIPYYAPKEELIQIKDSAQLRKIEERDKQIKYAKKLEEQQAEAVERKKKEREEVRGLPSDYPWGKNAVDRDDSGRVKARKWMLDKDIPDNNAEFPGLAAQMGRQGAGAPLRGKSGRPRTKLTGKVVDASTGQDKDVYDPWGRPGGGAPQRDRYGHTTGAGVYGAHAKKRSAHEHVSVDKREAEMEYGMDVASWMRTGEVGMPKTRNPVTGQPTRANKNTSDITAIRYNIRPTCTHSNDGKCHEYFTDLQRQAEQRQKEIQRQKEAERKLELEHVERNTNMWDGGEVKVRSRQRPRDDETERAKQVEKKLEYCNDLQRMINDQNEQKRSIKANKIQSEREHIATFDRVWGRPGAGAPRVNQDGQLETVSRNDSMIKTHVYDGWHFRRT